MTKYPNWKRNALRTLLLYAFDMGIAIAGWTYGFGLHVRNWWALVLLLIVSRFVFHIVTRVSYCRGADEKAWWFRYFAKRYYIESRVNDEGEPLYPTMRGYTPRKSKNPLKPPPRKP